MQLDSYATRIARLLAIAFFPLMLTGSAGAEIALGGTALAFLLHSHLTRNWAWLRAPWFTCLLALWGYMMLRGILAEDPGAALSRAVPFLRFPLAAAALSWVLQDKITERRFTLSLVATLCFLIGDSLLQYVAGQDIFGNPRIIENDHYRLTGPFSKKKLIVGIMLAWLSMPASLYLLKQKKLAYGVAFSLASLATIALSGERMALLLALFGWGITFFLLLRRKWLMLPLMAGGITLIGILVFAVPTLFERQVQATINTLTYWQESPYGKIMASDVKLAQINPVFGLGANHFRIACPRLYPDADKDALKLLCNIHPHNIYFEWWIEQGIIGFALFLGFLACMFISCRNAWPVMRENPLFLGWAVAFFLRIWPIGSTTGFFSNWGAPPFWLVTGALLAYCVREKEAA